MDIRIDSNFNFSVNSIQYLPNGKLCLSLTLEEKQPESQYRYEVSLGCGLAEKKPVVSLLQYAKDFAASASIKANTKDSYRLMCNHLEEYGDCTMDNVTTAYLQGFIEYLQEQGLKAGTVRLYFQKLACVLHDAYKNGFFDDRILQRVKRPRRESTSRRQTRTRGCRYVPKQRHCCGA